MTTAEMRRKLAEALTQVWERRDDPEQHIQARDTILDEVRALAYYEAISTAPRLLGYLASTTRPGN